MKTIPLTQAHVHREVGYMADGKWLKGTIVGVRKDGGFVANFPGECTIAFNSLNRVVELESRQEEEAAIRERYVVLVPTEAQSRSMEVKSFLAFLEKEGVCLCGRPDDDPNRPIEYSKGTINTFVARYLKE